MYSVYSLPGLKYSLNAIFKGVVFIITKVQYKCTVGEWNLDAVRNNWGNFDLEKKYITKEVHDVSCSIFANPNVEKLYFNLNWLCKNIYLFLKKKQKV